MGDTVPGAASRWGNVPVDDLTRDLPQGSPLRLGAQLVWASSATIMISAWLVVPGDRLLSTYVVAAAISAAAGVLRLLPERLLAGRRLVAFPLLVLIELAVIGGTNRGAGQAYLSLVVLGFIYLGLACPPRTSWLVLPPAALAWLVASNVTDGALPTTALIRLPIAMVLWLLVGELLAHRSARLQAYTELLVGEAATDPLTGLSNRRALPGILERARPGDAVLMLDVDHFRSINTTRGHGGGDDVLRTFAAAIREVVHSWDSVVRYGGEEVLLLLSGTITSGEMDSLLRRIRELWRQREPGLTFSAGGVLIRPGQPAVDALAEADRLLYEAKEAGRDCWRLRGHRTESAPPTPESAASIPAQASAPEADRFPTAR